MEKIWIFNHYAKHPSVNTQNRHNQFAKQLKKYGYEVTIFFSSHVHNSSINLIEDNRLYKDDYIDGIRYIAIRTRSYTDSGKQRVFNMVDFYRRLTRYVESNKHLKNFAPDVIYASSVHPLTLLAGIKIAKKFKVRCVCEVRDLWPLTLVKMGRIEEKSLIAQILYIMEKYIYKKADKLIFTMSGGKQYVIDQGWSKRIDTNKIYHINNGVNIGEFETYKRRYSFYHKNSKKEDFKVTYTGSIGQANMVQTIIEAAKIIDNETDENIIFEIFGDGLKRREIEEYIKNENISNVNVYGKVEPKYIPSILSRSNVNVIVGKNSDLYKYGFSQNKFFNYLASKKPLISNREVHNILEDSGSGIVVEPEDPRALAKGILKFYEMSEKEYKIYCENAYKLAKEYDYKNLTNKLVKVLRD